MKKNNFKKISVIIPVFNEIGNVKTLNKLLLAELKAMRVPFELVYMDDMSTDGTFEYLNKQSKTSPQVFVYKKLGKPGKSYSLLEGFHKAHGDVLVMIDGDLQYPPSAIPGMIHMLEKGDIVVANRKKFQASKLRRVLSRGFRSLFGTALFGLRTDVQSGLKVFRKDVFLALRAIPRSPWTFDLEFLYRAREAGYKIVNYDIAFAPRENGSSKVHYLKQVLEIGSNALLVKLTRMKPISIPAMRKDSMIGAGIGYKKNRYITHTSLPYHKTALQTFVRSQLFIIFLLIAFFVTSSFLWPLTTARTAITIISVVYFIDVLFNLYVIMRSLRNNPEINIDDREVNLIPDDELPIYSILCPLYKEAAILPQFLNAIEKLEWPKRKLDVILLLEEDDTDTIAEIKKMRLPFFVRPVIVPLSQPKTKPKACNYGLNIAKGEYIVIYDAEDIPDPLQLKKAYIGFLKQSEKTICLQAKLNYYNPHQNWLTKFFSAEYSLWFDLILPGLQSINTNIPLGGTSNHFRTSYLRKLQGWDTFNVTEDADLGIRLFKEGYKTAIIDSVTLEEANSNPRNWIRQRSRWIKGYLQSYLVHMRDIWSFGKSKGIHAFLFQLTIGSKLTFIFLNPFLWLATISYFALYSIVGPTLELVYIAPAFYLGAISLVFGNFLFLYYYMIGCAKRKQWDLIYSALFIPIYWLMVSIAGWVALYQLIFKPHYWEKTIHGLHLQKKKKAIIPAIQIEVETPIVKPVRKSFSLQFNILSNVIKMLTPYKRNIITSSILMMAVTGAHIMNLVYNIIIYRIPTISLETISIISLVASLAYLASVPFSSLQAAISHKTALSESRYNKQTAAAFWGFMRNQVVLVSLVSATVWLIISPTLQSLFKTQSILPFVFFSLVWLVGFRFSVDRGYLSGKLLFINLAGAILIEPFYKVILSVILIYSGYENYVYIAIPLAFVLAYVSSAFFIPRFIKLIKSTVSTEALAFPSKFFSASILASIANVTFMSVDILLANHFLAPEEAGKYALLSLCGKMIFFLGGLTTQFVIPFVSKLEGKNKNTELLFYYSVISTGVVSGIGFIAFGILGSISLPLLFGEKASYILPYVFAFSFGMFCFTISKTIVSYYLAKNIYTFPATVVLLSFVQITLITFRHATLLDFVYTMAALGQFHLLVMLFLHRNNKTVIAFEKALGALISKENQIVTEDNTDKKQAILFLNWRDTRHKWSGGAEVYIHEIAKRWVTQGKDVTVFCGNDKKSPRNEIIDGVRIIRRGGAYTVYIWAVIYYVFFLRKKTDVVIDCENGIPFFSPFYVRKPIFLIIHHVHQEVFRKYLIYPVAKLVAIMESKLMPYAYRNKPVITVSESSKKSIIDLGFSHPENIEIVYNGIDATVFKPRKKTRYPSFIYLGRLKPHKNIDIAIKAFAKVLRTHKTAVLRIVGEGESLHSLQQLAQQLKIERNVIFYGKVSNDLKAQLLAESWVMIQPSQVEGWGITVIEANSSGTPVIASRVNGLKDSVVDKETGLLIECGNVEAFCTAMLVTIEDKKLLQKLSTKSTVWSKRFTWEKSAEALDSIIQGVLPKQADFPRYGDIFLAQEETINI